MAYAPSLVLAPRAKAENLDFEGDIDEALKNYNLEAYNGIAAFIVPGCDEFSLAQGVSTNMPGGVDAQAGQFTIEHFNQFLPVPRPTVPLWAQAHSAALPPEFANVPELTMLESDDAKRIVQAYGEPLESLVNNGRVPISILVAILIDVLARFVEPIPRPDPFRSYFARVSWNSKAHVFRLWQRWSVRLSNLPVPVVKELAGLFAFVSSAILMFTGFEAFGEQAVLDPETRQLTGRPVGWEITGYNPNGIVEGWDDFQGYFQGRTEADA